MSSLVNLIGVFLSDGGEDESIVVDEQFLYLFANSDYVIRTFVRNRDGSPKNLSGGAVVLAIRRTVLDADPLLSRQATVLDPASGIADVPISAAELFAMLMAQQTGGVPKVNLLFDVVFVDGGDPDSPRSVVVPAVLPGAVPAPANARLVLVAGVGRPGEPVTPLPSQPPIGIGAPNPIPFDAVDDDPVEEVIVNVPAGSVAVVVVKCGVSRVATEDAGAWVKKATVKNFGGAAAFVGGRDQDLGIPDRDDDGWDFELSVDPTTGDLVGTFTGTTGDVHGVIEASTTFVS